MDTAAAGQAAGFWAGGWRTLRSWGSNPDLVSALVRRDILTRYRGSVLGLLWSVLNPLVLLLTYTVVFGVFFKMSWGEGLDWRGSFVVMLFCGLIPFNFFSEVVTRAPQLIANSPNYVKRVAFPVELLPMVTSATALFHAAVGTLLLLGAMTVLHGHLHPTTPYLLLYWIPLTCFTLSVALVLSAMAVFLRDLQHIVGLLTSVLFFLTPVFYPESMIPPRVWHYWQFVNPLAYVASQFRRVIVLGFAPDWPSLLLLTALCAAALWLAAAWFATVRRRFADVI